MSTSNTTTVRINEVDLVAYIKEYYDKIIASQLQANYGRVTINMGLPAEFEQLNSQLPPFHQALYEKKLKELRDKVSFDGFNQDVSNPSVIAHGTSTDPIDFSSKIIQTRAESTQIRQNINQTNGDKDEEEEDDEILLVPISLVPNAGPIATDAQKYKGKSLTLGRDVEFNDVIFAERPLSSLNIEPEYARVCDYCLRPITSLDEQIWSMLMAGDKKPTSTQAHDVLALLNEIAPFRDVINEFIYLSSVGDDDEEEEHKELIKSGKLTTAQFEKIKSELNNHYLVDHQRASILEFYRHSVLRVYNYTMKELHNEEKQLISQTTTPTSTALTTPTASPTPSDDQAMHDVQQAVYDLIEEAGDIEILDINEEEKLHVFEPSTRFAEVANPVYSPYTEHMYCSIRCLCISYNNYEHILAHAYQRVDLGHFSEQIGSSDETGGKNDQNLDQIDELVDDDEEDEEDEGDLNGDNDNNNEGIDDNTALPVNIKLKPTDPRKKTQVFPLKPVPNTPKSPLPTPSSTTSTPSRLIVPGQLTTSVDTIPGPSGLPFLHMSGLYKDLIHYTRTANPMFLQHVRALTQAVSFWGIKLVECMGGDYNDVISLFAMQSRFVSVNHSPVSRDIMNLDSMVRVHNHYLAKYHQKGHNNTDIEDMGDISVVEDSINLELGHVMETLETKFKSRITTLRNQHGEFITARKAKIMGMKKDGEVEDAFAALSVEEKGDETKNDGGKDDGNAIELFSPKNKQIQGYKCFCTECLGQISFSLLQYCIFPYLLFTQTQWFSHVHDAKGDNFFSHLKKNPADFEHILTKNSQNSPNNLHDIDHPPTPPTPPHPQVGDVNTNATQYQHMSLFRQQIELLMGLQDHFEPIIQSYSQIIAIYCSFITPLYQTCLKRLENNIVNNIPMEECLSTQSPYFVDVMTSTLSLDSTKLIPIPYSDQNVKETMNDITTRVGNFADAVQRPVDVTNWLVLSQFVSICEMNNIQIAPKSAVIDVIEFFTVYNLKEIDPEDVEEVEEKMALMYQAGLNVHCRENNLVNNAQLDKKMLPIEFQSEENYIESILKICGQLNKKRVKKAAPNSDSETTSESGDYAKAWSLLNNRSMEYPDCSGLFRVCCTMNHSCDPNCTVIGLGDGRSNLVAVVALRDIKKGEELTISYIDDDMTYSQRQNELKDYQFQCGCKRCLADKKKIQLKKQQQLQASKTTTKSTTKSPTQVLKQPSKSTSATTTATTKSTTQGTAMGSNNGAKTRPTANAGSKTAASTKKK
jgi:hypothetical protein